MGKISIEEAEINNVIYKGGVKGESTMNQTEILMKRLIERGIGYRTIEDILRLRGISKDHSQICKWAKRMGIKCRRVYDENHGHKKQRLNENVHITQIDYVVDYCRWVNGSINDKHHDRANLLWEDDKELQICIIRNVHTNKIYWLIHDSVKESIDKLEMILIKAQMNGEKLDGAYIEIDRAYSSWAKVVKDKFNITAVCYGKTVERPYNSNVEQPINIIQKWAQAMKVDMLELKWEQAKEYANAILEIYYNRNAIPMMKIAEREEEEELEQIKAKQIIKQ